jgi:hypothetical protein
VAGNVLGVCTCVAVGGLNLSGVPGLFLLYFFFYICTPWKSSKEFSFLIDILVNLIRNSTRTQKVSIMLKFKRKKSSLTGNLC